MKRMKKTSGKVCSLALATVMAVVTVLGNGTTLTVKAENYNDADKIQLTNEDITELTQTANYSFTREAVHDPSIINGRNGYYYVFGSHMATAKTKDLMNWTNVSIESETSSLFGTKDEEGNIKAVSYNQAFRNNEKNKVTVLVNGVETEVDFGTYDASAWNTARANYTVQGNMWAPDVVYNPMMGKWCMYLSLNGQRWNSSIVLLTAEEIEGPYVYQGPVIYSGFSEKVEALSYKNTDLELVCGELNELPDKYKKVDEGTWGRYLPHAIDPCTFYDEEGKLWMSYGSWSGGIYIIELDEKTGLRDYTVKYESNIDELDKDVTSDEYFGKKIAGGYYVSGEGSYIQHIGGYYYLFMSYGGYAPDAGYNMRIFRSEKPDGPYVDTKGISAIYNGSAVNYTTEKGMSIRDTRGEKLMTNYQWNTMKIGECSQGHNSAFVDPNGRAFVVYHTKFNDGSVGHQLRVHELFLNENGWLVASPYEYTGDKALDVKNEVAADVRGDYEVIVNEYNAGGNGSYANNIKVITPVSVTLNEDGTVTGALSGSWNIKEGTPYVTLELDGNTYKGVFVKQTIDATGMETVCFTVVDEATGLTIWGSKNVDDAKIVALNASVCKVTVPERTFKDIKLPDEGVQGAVISWTSSDTSVISNEGKLGDITENTKATLTQRIEKGKYFYERTYDIIAMPKQTEKEMLVASYLKDEEVDLYNRIDGSLNFANPYYDGNSTGIDISRGVKISFDVVPTGKVNTLGTILGFGDAGKLYFTPGSYLGYNALGGYFDANMANYALVKDYIGEAYAKTGKAVNVKLVFTSIGYEVYIDDELAYNQNIQKTENGSGDLDNYRKVLSWLNESASTVYLGYGSWWSADGYDNANAKVSNLEFYILESNKTEDNPDEEVAKIEFTKDVLEIKDNSYIEYMENPFYGKNVKELSVQYTINFADSAAKNGWDGIFAFYNSQTNGRISIQTAPYICYNEENGNWIDVNGAGNKTNQTGNMAKGTDYTFKLYVNEDGAQFYMNDEEIEIALNGSGATYADLLKYVSKCDKFTWGVGKAVSSYWWTELCTVKDITLATYELKNEVVVEPETPEEKPVQNHVGEISVSDNTLSVDEITIVTNDYLYATDNPFHGKTLDSVTMNYEIAMAEAAAKNGWDGIFSFYEKNGSGRISIQTAPYVCYNDMNGKWMDINQPGNDGATDVAPGFATDEKHKVSIFISKESLTIAVDGEAINYSVNGSDEASYETLLEFLSQCDGLSFGVGLAKTSFWNTELCKIDNLVISVTEAEEPSTEAPSVEEPSTEAPSTEAPSVEEPSTEAPSVEEPSTEAPSVEAPTEQKTETEAERADRLYREAVHHDDLILSSDKWYSNRGYYYIAKNASASDGLASNMDGQFFDASVMATDYGYVRYMNKVFDRMMADVDNKPYTIYIGGYTYLNRKMAERIAKLNKDLRLVYIVKGKQYFITIPAGTDISDMLDKNGYAGPAYIGTKLGTIK